MRPEEFDAELARQMDRFTAPLPDPSETAALVERLRPLAAARRRAQDRFRHTGLNRHPVLTALDWLTVQTHLLHPGFWAASALLLAVMLGAASLLGVTSAGRALAIAAPLPALLGVAYAFRTASGPSAEMELACPVSPVQVVLGRTLVVLGYNLLLGAAGALAAGWAAPDTVTSAGMLLLGWLGPLFFLVGLTLFLTVVVGIYPGLIAGMVVWGAQALLWPQTNPAYRSLLLYRRPDDAWVETQVVALALGLILLLVSHLNARRLVAPKGG